MRESPILVIGGTRGTGRLIAELLSRRGDVVRVLARNPERAEARVGTIAGVVGGDITRKESLLVQSKARATSCSRQEFGAAAPVWKR
jgi:NAD(P)-dependent dehydrogenase (short-subunit alcohol dehydrogenase family)